MTMPDQKTVCTVVSTIYFRNVFLQPAVSDNTRPALSKPLFGILDFFLPRQSNRYHSIHSICQIKAAMLQIPFLQDTSDISR